MPRHLGKFPSLVLLLLCLPFAAHLVRAQSSAHKAQKTASALLISDIHFEPFWDPTKVPQLAAAPASTWAAILSSPPSADQTQRFAALQQTCHARGVDTSYALYQASLTSMRAHATGVRFAVVSGDLIAHSFDCKYNTLFPHSTPAAYRAFVEKTITFVVNELKTVAPGSPVYVTLGNNDSGCGDYKLDAHSTFLAETGPIIASALSTHPDMTAVHSFSAYGDYSVPLPAPFRKARLIALDDLFQSSKYANCSAKPDAAAVQAQLGWLERQLAEARVAKQKVWVMAHIPPGVNAYSTMAKGKNICGGKKPTMFLSSGKLTTLLTDYADVVQLALFAHTHMDEIKLLSGKGGKGEVALKQIPSISPIDGNNPAFTVAQIDPASLRLVDYQVVASSDASGSGTWAEEYDYAHSYGEPDFSAGSVADLLRGFASDPHTQTAASQAYLQHFDVGHPQPLMNLFWPVYTCAQTIDSGKTFSACVCGAKR